MAIMGTFMYEEDFLSAAKNLKLSGFDNISLLSPLPLEEAQEVLGLGKSPVRRFALAGAIIGAISGFAMAAGTALVFILPTGGQGYYHHPAVSHNHLRNDDTVRRVVYAAGISFRLRSARMARQTLPAVGQYRSLCRRRGRR